MTTIRLTAIFAFFFLLCVAHDTSAYCPGDTSGTDSVSWLPPLTGNGQISISYNKKINHGSHPTCFGSMDAAVFTNTGCGGEFQHVGHLPSGSPSEITAMELCPVPCAQYFNIGGQFLWNELEDSDTDGMDNQRYMCDCQPPPEGCTDGCIFSQWTCACDDCCPLLFDTSGKGYKLTSADRGVYFDINADGVQDAISWTDPARDVAFLAFDRNGNGAIDHGEELFGNMTPLPPGSPQQRADHGFDALASLEHESYGPSVRDGTIDARDAAYHKLLFWKDISHDGVSQPGELQRASAVGLIAVETRFRENRRRDEYGNEYRLRGISWWQRRGRLDARLFYDVWFVPRR